MATKSFTVFMNTENQLTGKESETPRVLEVIVRAPESPSAVKRPALNLALVLDRSGSMTGPKLEYVRQAAAHVLDLLKESDRVALVTYDNEVSVVAESTPLTNAARAELKQRVAAIRSGGSTNLSGGWAAGCEQVARQIGPGGQIDRALLLTDGLANVGITDLEALAVHARELAERGVSTSTFGVGEGFNEYLLEAMAQQGRGSFYFISDPEDIPQIFAREFDELGAVTARDVELELELPEGVKAEVLGGLPCQHVGARLRISLGSLMGGREQPVYFQLLLPPQAAGEAITLRALARARGLDEQMQETSGDLSYHYAGQAVIDTIHPNREVLERAARVILSRAASDAIKLERTGQREAGAQLMHTALEAQRKNLSPDQVEYYETLILRMRRGMEELHRKVANYDAYLARNNRIDPIFEKRRKRE